MKINWGKVIREVFMYALGIAIVWTTLIVVQMAFKVSIPPENRDLIMLVVGVIIGKFGTVVDYFFGSSKGSSDKNDVIGKKSDDASA